MNLRPDHIRPFSDDPVHGRMNGHTTEKAWSGTVLQVSSGRTGPVRESEKDGSESGV